MKIRSGNTLIPAVAVILSLCAAIGVFAFSIWPKDSEFDIEAPRIKTNTANVNESTNGNTNTVNENVNTAGSNIDTNKSSEEDVTRGWKSYTSSSMSLSLKHPASWQVYTCPDVAAVWIGTQRVVCDSEGPTDDFAVTLQPSNFDLETTLASAKKDKTNPEDTKVSIAGTTGTRVRGASPTALFGTPAYSDAVFFQHDGRYYIASYIVTGMKEKLRTEFEAFIGTLQFSN